MRKVLGLGRRDVILECAAMLEHGSPGGSLMEAAELYEAAGEAEKACSIFIQAKAFAKAGPLMKGVKSSKLLLAVCLTLPALEGLNLQSCGICKRSFVMTKRPAWPLGTPISCTMPEYSWARAVCKGKRGRRTTP
jgi:hypothetical protein